MFIPFLLSRYGIAAIALLLSLVGFQAWKLHYGHVKKEQGRQEVVQNSKEQGAKINAKIKKSLSGITDDSANSELRKRYSRSR